MTMKHIKFEDSPTMRSLEKVAKERGMFKTSEIEEFIQKVETKRATAKERGPTKSLVNDLFKLAAGMRKRGLEKEADRLEEKIHIYRQAEVHLYDVFDEEGEDFLDFAYPDGDVEIAPATNEYGKVETPQSAHKKIVDRVMKTPTGKYAQLATVNWDSKISEMSEAFARYMNLQGMDFDDDDAKDVLERAISEEMQRGNLSKATSGQDASRLVSFFVGNASNTAPSWAAQIKADMQQAQAAGRDYVMDQAVDAAASGMLISAVGDLRKSKGPLGEGETGYATASSIVQATADALGFEKSAANTREQMLGFVGKGQGVVNAEDILSAIEAHVESKGYEIVRWHWNGKAGFSFTTSGSRDNIKEQLEPHLRDFLYDKLHGNNKDPIDYFQKIKSYMVSNVFTHASVDSREGFMQITPDIGQSIHKAIMGGVQFNSVADATPKKKAPATGPGTITWEFMSLVVKNLVKAQMAFKAQKTDAGALWATKAGQYMRIIGTFYTEGTSAEAAPISSIIAALRKVDPAFTETTFDELLEWSKKFRDSSGYKAGSAEEKIEKVAGPLAEGPTQPASMGMPAGAKPKGQLGPKGRPTEQDKKAVKAMQLALSTLAQTLQKGALNSFPVTKAKYPDIVNKLLATQDDNPKKPSTQPFDGWWGPNTSDALERAEALRNEYNANNQTNTLSNQIYVGGKQGLRYLPGHAPKAQSNTLVVSALNNKIGGTARAGADITLFDRVMPAYNKGEFLETHTGTIDVKSDNLKNLWSFYLFLRDNKFPWEGRGEAHTATAVSRRYLARYINLFKMRANRKASAFPRYHDYVVYTDGLYNDFMRIMQYLSPAYFKKQEEEPSVAEKEEAKKSGQYFNTSENNNLAKLAQDDPEMAEHIPLNYLKELGAQDVRMVGRNSGVNNVQTYYQLPNGQYIPSPYGRHVNQGGQYVEQGQSHAFSRERFQNTPAPIWDTLIMESGDFSDHFQGFDYLPELNIDQVKYWAARGEKGTKDFANFLFGSAKMTGTKSTMDHLDKFITNMVTHILPRVYKRWERTANRKPAIKRESLKLMGRWQNILQQHQDNIHNWRRPPEKRRYRQYTYR